MLNYSLLMKGQFLEKLRCCGGGETRGTFKFQDKDENEI